MIRLAFCLLGVALTTAGCGWFTKSKPETGTTGTTQSNSTNADNSRISVTPDTSPIGTVARVNVSARFVIITFPVGTLPTPGQEMFIYRHGLKVGDVKVSAPQQDNNTAADIIAGEAGVGDEARTK